MLVLVQMLHEQRCVFVSELLCCRCSISTMLAFDGFFFCVVSCFCRLLPLCGLDRREADELIDLLCTVTFRRKGCGWLKEKPYLYSSLVQPHPVLFGLTQNLAFTQRGRIKEMSLFEGSLTHIWVFVLHSGGFTSCFLGVWHLETIFICGKRASYVSFKISFTVHII